MKLYTEEQVRKIFQTLSNYTGYDYNMENYNFNEEPLTPIELPSDEEIIKGHDPKEFQFISFWAGAAWYRNQILNQNK